MTFPLKKTFVFAVLFCLLSLLFFTVFPANTKANPIATFVTSEGTLVENFNNLADWANVAGSQSADTVYFKEGTQGLRITSLNSVESYSTKIITSTDLSTATNIAFWAYVFNRTADADPSQTLYYITLLLSSTSDWTKYFHRQITYTYLRQGWNRVVINKADFVDVGTADWSNIIKIRIRVRANTGQNTSVTFDYLTYDYNLASKAKCVIAFDEGYPSTYTKAKPIMDANGQKGVAFVITGGIGTTGYMTLSQLTDLKNDGWDVSAHCNSTAHYSLTSVSQTTLENEVTGSYNWLVANGFSESAMFFAYPYGDYNDTVVDEVKKNYALARSTIEGEYEGWVVPGDMQYSIKAKEVSNATTVANVEARIDDAIIQKSYVVLYFHTIVDADANTTGKYLTSDFQAISDYIASKSAYIDVVTFNDLLATYTASITTDETPVEGQTVTLSITVTRNGTALTNYLMNITTTQGDLLNVDNATFDYTSPTSGEHVFTITALYDNELGYNVTFSHTPLSLTWTNLFGAGGGPGGSIPPSATEPPSETAPPKPTASPSPFVWSEVDLFVVVVVVIAVVVIGALAYSENKSKSRSNGHVKWPEKRKFLGD